MGQLVIHAGVKINGVLSSGAGDPILTADSTTGEVGQIGAIDTATFIPATLTNGYVLVGNGSNVATGVAVTGDVLISNGGVTSINTGVIVNADINASAAIALSKLAATTTSRALVSDGSGIITPATTTAVEIGYVNGVTSAIQPQLDAKVASSTLTTNGDIFIRSGGSVTRLPIGTNGYVLGVTAGLPAWEAKQPVPNGGTTDQYLAKNSNTDGDVSWVTLTTSKITDVTASAAELNIMDGVIASTAEINFVDGVTSNIQTQLDAKQATVTGAASTIVSSNLTASRAAISNGSGKLDVSTTTSAELGYVSGVTSPIQGQLNAKLSTALAQHAIYVGNAANIATALVVGSEGQILTVSGGAPTWVTAGAGGTVTSVDISGGTTGLSSAGGPITTSGTLTLSGTLVAANGGTGQTSYTVGDLLCASGATALSKLAGVATGNALISGGVATAPSWGKIALTTHVSGQLPLANGGTAANLSDPNADRILFWDDSAGQVTWLTAGTGLSISGTTITATGAGDVVGPASATNNAVVVFDSTTGKLIKNSDLIYSSGSLSRTGALIVAGSSGSNTFGNASLFTNLVGLVRINSEVSSTAPQATFVAGQQGATSENAADVHVHGGKMAGGTSGNSGNAYIYGGANLGSGLEGNVAINTSNVSNWQSMERGIFIANSTTIPTGNPTDGGFLYAEAGALKWRGSGGTITTLGAA